jgi:hypothetical protein
MMMIRSKRSSSRPLIAMAMLAVLFMMAAPMAASEGPWLDVTSHSDGDVVTDRQVTVRGTVSEPTQTLSFSGEDLAHAQMANVRWLNDNLTFRPKLMFSDQFNGPLDPSKWTIVRDPQNVTIEAGALKINFQWVWPSPVANGTLVKSTEFQIPDGVDYQATYRMKLTSYGYSGAGGGISDGSTSPYSSHLATLGFWSGGVPYTWVKVLADGQAYYNATTADVDWHDYTLSYDTRTDAYTCYRDTTSLATYTMDTSPNIFWFGHTEDQGLYDMRPVLEVDYVDVWGTSGEWISDVIDVGHYIELDGADLAWNSSSRKDADVMLEVRSSIDEEEWTEWVAFDEEGGLEASVNGSYLQLRMRLAMPGVLREQAHITVTGIDLHYRNPLVTVDVRTQDTDWVPTEGAHEWQADLVLSEDTNTISVRAIDTSGAENVTTFEMVVDTTLPVGTMSIAGEGAYTNDLNVTLLLSATDKYGVEWVDISHFPDFSRKVRLPYSTQADWRMSEVEGETWVYVRFVDSNGLVSETLTDKIYYDSFPPIGSVVIDGAALFTSGRDVQLGLEYSDNIEVAKVELSNDADFTEPYIVPDGTYIINDWQLTEGGDGPRAVHMRVTDVAGNVVTDSDGIELYEPKPVGSITIENGADLAGHPVVTLTIDVPHASGARLMQISNDPSFVGADWAVVENEVWWILPDGDGEKTVYMRIVDFRDVESVPVFDTIILDQTAPQVTVTLDGGSPYTTDVTVSGTVGYDDASGAVQMWVSMDETFNLVRPEEYSGTFEFIIPSRESDHRIYVRVEDEAGNLGLGSAVIHYATIRPHIALALPQGNIIQITDTIPVEVTPTDPYGDIHLQVGFDDRPDEDGAWMPLNGLVHVDVPEGKVDGVHTIWIRARNAAGLTSEEPVAIGLTFDTVAPMLSILQPLDGTKLFRKDREVILEVDVSDTSRLHSLVYEVDGGDPLDLPTRQHLVNLSLDKWGEHTIRVTAEDVAGNVATSTTVFKLADADDLSTGSGTGLMLIIVMAILGAAIIAGFTYNRRYMPGLRRTTIIEGDGWHEDWDHPEMEECDDDKRPCHLPVSPDDPVYQARMEAKRTKAPEVSVDDIAGTELENVDIPEELKADQGQGSPGDEWSEM